MATMYQSDVSENVYEQEWGELATRPTPRFDPSLMKVKKDELQRGLLEGRYTPEAVNEVIFREKYAQLGLLDLDKTDVLTGLKTGGLTAEQANSWADHKENPGWFWTKELVWRGAIGGIMRGFQNTKELFDEAIAMLTPDDPDGLNALIDSFGGGTFAPEGTTVTAKEQKELIGKLTPNLPQTDKPVTGAGQLVGAVTQFGSGFIGGQRIMKAVVPGMNYLKMGLTTEGKGVLAAAKEAKLINSSWADFAMKYPRAAWATGHLVENYGAGAITDFAVWGPDQDRLADWLVQFPWAKDTFLEYLTSDPEDHFTLARAKNAIEGGLTGVVAEPILKGIFHLLKGAKGSIWTKMGYDKEAVADVAADLRGKVEAKAQALAEPPDLAWVNYKPGMKSTGVSETKLPFVQEPEPLMKSLDEVELKKFLAELPEEQRAGVEIKQIGNEFVLADKAWFLHNDAHDIILSDAKQGELYEKLVKGEAVNPLELMKYPKLRALVEGISEGKNRIPSDMGLEALTPAKQKEIVDCLVTIMSGGRNIVKEGGQPFQNWGKFITNPEFSDAWDTALKKVLGDADKYGAVKAHMTFEDIERIGRFYDMSPERIAKMNKEVSGFAAKLSKMQQVLADYSAYVDDLVERALKADDDGLMVEALEHIKTLGDMYINAKGVKTAMGRNLATLKMVKQGNALGGAEWAQKFAENEFTKGGDARLLLKKYKANTDVRSKLQYAKTLESKHYVLEAILELEQASLVSGVTTNMFNVMGQGIATVFEGISRSLAATYMGRQMGEGWTREFLSTQWQGYLYGMRAAVAMPEQFWKEAKALNLRKAWQGIDVTDRSQGLVWRAGKACESVLDPLTKFEGVDSSALKYTLGKVAGDAGRATGEVLTASFRPLTMADEFFRSVNYYSHLFSTHFEAGWKEGLRGDKLNEYVNLAIKNPSVASVNDALRRSRDTTLNANMPRWLEKINQAAQGSAVGLTIKILALPFVKIPANIARYQWEIGPGGTMARLFAAKGLDSATIAKMSGRFAEDYAAGGLRRQEAIARVYLGNFLVVMGAMGYMSGNMTSGMLPWERSAAQTAGIRGNAVQVGDHQIPIDRYAPVMSMFVMGADLARLAMAGVESAQGEVDVDQVLKMMPLLADSMLSQVGLKDVNAVLTSLFDSRGITADSASAGVGGKIQSIAPFSGLVKNLYMMFGDGEKKRIWSAWDGVVGSYLRNSLQTTRHPIFGEKLDNDPMFYMGKNQRDPLTTELFKLGVDMRPMDRKLTRGNQEIKLTPKDYDRVHEILESQNVRGDLQTAFNRMADVNDERIKAARLSGIISKHRAAAQGKFLMERPDLIEQLRQGGQATAEAARGGPTRHDAKKYSGDKPWLNNLINQ